MLLVMAVLAGVLGMHGLAPGPAAAPQRGNGHTMVMAHSGEAARMSDACAHPDGSTDHLAHADATCAAAGTVSAYAPPALSAALPGAPAPVAGATGVPASAGSGRAPPDLSELQLLRI